MVSIVYVIHYTCGCVARRYEEDDYREIDFCMAHHLGSWKRQPIGDGTELEPQRTERS